MSVDRDEVRRVAELAKLDLGDDEEDRLAREMSRILEHAERLRALDDGGRGAGSASDARLGAEAGSSVPDDSPGRGPGQTSSRAGSEPDALLRPPGSFAPEMIEGFFAVPPPPGVVADAPGDAPDAAGDEAEAPGDEADARGDDRDAPDADGPGAEGAGSRADGEPGEG